MAEWPITICETCAREDGGSCIAEDDKIEVIPADLARELYEALNVLAHGGALRHGRNLSETIDHALARYEREVGDG